MRGSRYLNRAIVKYGKEIWKVRRIDTAYSLPELNKKEDYWVKKYDSTNPDKGYNLREGGDGRFVNPETIEKFREANKRQFSDPQNIEKHREILRKLWEKDEYRKKQDIARNSPEFKGKMRNARYKDWNNPKYRNHMEKIMKSDEYKEKQRASQKKRYDVPGAREAQSKRAESQWKNSVIKDKHLRARADPEYKKRQSEAMKGKRNAYKEITNKKEFLSDIKNKMQLKDMAQKYKMSGNTVNEKIKEMLGAHGVKNYTGAKKYLKDKDINNILKDIEGQSVEKQDNKEISENKSEASEKDQREEQEEKGKNEESSEESNEEPTEEKSEEPSEEVTESPTEKEKEEREERPTEQESEKSQSQIGENVSNKQEEQPENSAEKSQTETGFIDDWDWGDSIQNKSSFSDIEEIDHGGSSKKDYEGIGKSSFDKNIDYKGIDELSDGEEKGYKWLDEDSMEEGNDFDGIDDYSSEANKDYDDIDEDYNGGCESGGQP